MQTFDKNTGSKRKLNEHEEGENEEQQQQLQI